MNKTIEHVELEAGKKIPRDEVSLRDGGGGKRLSYLEAHYVIQRMNDVFGPMGWDQEVVEMRQVNKDTDKPAYIAKVRISAIVNTGEGYMKCFKEDYGFGSDKSGLNPHEMASKEAVSDAFKRAARQFGMSLGLALYSKEQENVEDAPQKTPQQSAQIAASPVAFAKAAAQVLEKHAPAKDWQRVSLPDEVVHTSGKSSIPQVANNNREALNKRITAMSTVVLAKAGGAGTPERAAKLAELKADMKSKYMTDVTTALTDAEAAYLLQTLEKLANGS